MYINNKELTKIESAINVLKELSSDKENGLLFYCENIKECSEIINKIRQRQILYDANEANRKANRQL